MALLGTLFFRTHCGLERNILEILLFGQHTVTFGSMEGLDAFETVLFFPNQWRCNNKQLTRRRHPQQEELIGNYYYIFYN